MDIETKGQIERLIDYAEENYGEWKIVLQKTKDGDFRYHCTHSGDLPKAEVCPQVIRKRVIVQDLQII